MALPRELAQAAWAPVELLVELAAVLPVRLRPVPAQVPEEQDAAPAGLEESVAPSGAGPLAEQQPAAARRDASAAEPPAQPASASQVPTPQEPELRVASAAERMREALPGAAEEELLELLPLVAEPDARMAQASAIPLQPEPQVPQGAAEMPDAVELAALAELLGRAYVARPAVVAERLDVVGPVAPSPEPERERERLASVSRASARFRNSWRPVLVLLA